MVKEQLLKKIYQLYKIPVYVFREDLKAVLLRIPEDAPLFSDMNEEILQLIKNTVEESAAFFMEDEQYFWGAMCNPEKKLIVFGPMSQKQVGDSAALVYRHRHKLEGNFIPCHLSMKAVRQILSILELEINGHDIEEDAIRIASVIQTVMEWNTDAEQEEYQLEQSELERDHNSIEYEERLIEIVRTGNLEEAEKAIYSGEGLGEEHIGVVAGKKEKQTEYLCVVMLTIISRAAVSGGMNQEKAYSLTDIYMRRLEKCKDSTEMYALASRAQYEFTYEVREAKKARSEIYYIEQCKDYIARNLRKPLKVGDIAPAIGINRSYLAKRFSEVEGITIQNYITKERCLHAANMLRYSNYPISLIAEYFCFSSQSHFGKCFSELYGMTPKTYRTKNQRK